jgi:hypothetical protein
MVVQMDFRGTAEEWQDYCRKITKLWRWAPTLRSIYLQRNEFEFEIEDEKLPGKVMGIGETQPTEYTK